MKRNANEMSNKSKAVAAVALCLLLGSLVGWQRWKIAELRGSERERAAREEAERYRATVERRRQERRLLESEVAYRDSLREIENERAREANSRANARIRREIDAIKGAPDERKDSLWVGQWNTPDGPLFENQ